MTGSMELVWMEGGRVDFSIQAQSNSSSMSYNGGLVKGEVTTVKKVGRCDLYPQP